MKLWVLVLAGGLLLLNIRPLWASVCPSPADFKNGELPVEQHRQWEGSLGGHPLTGPLPVKITGFYAAWVSQADEKQAGLLCFYGTEDSSKGLLLKTGTAGDYRPNRRGRNGANWSSNVTSGFSRGYYTCGEYPADNPIEITACPLLP